MRPLPTITPDGLLPHLLDTDESTSTQLRGLSQSYNRSELRLNSGSRYNTFFASAWTETETFIAQIRLANHTEIFICNFLRGLRASWGAMSASIKKSAHHMVAGFFKDVAIRFFLNGFFTVVNWPLLVKFVVHNSRASRTGKSKLSMLLWLPIYLSWSNFKLQ